MEKEVRTNYIAPTTEEQTIMVEGVIATSGKAPNYDWGGDLS